MISVVTAIDTRQDVPEAESQAMTEDDEEDLASEKELSKRKLKDPLQMFGILVPQPLRLAQAQAVKLVEEIVAQLVNVNMEMNRTEIEIRRKRKFKLRAESRPNASNEARTDTIEGTA